MCGTAINNNCNNKIDLIKHPPPSSTTNYTEALYIDSLVACM